jgi:predicted ester cyclase
MGRNYDNEQLVRRVMDEGFSQGRLEVIDELFAPDAIEHQFRGPGQPQSGPEGVKAVISGLRASFPDLQYAIEDLISDDDKVWVRMIGRGTNLGPYMGHPPTGRSIAIDVIDIVRIKDGRIVEHWGVPDRLGAMMRMGILSQPNPPLVPKPKNGS